MRVKWLDRFAVTIGACLLLGLPCAAMAQTASEYYAQGKTAASQGRDAEAIALFTRAIDKDPSLVAAYRDRGEAKRRTNDYPGAIEDLDRYLRVETADAFAFGRRCFLRLETGDHTNALADCNRALFLDAEKDTIYVLNNRARAHSWLGNKEHALADYSLVILIDPTYAIAYNNRGVVRRDIGDLAGATQDLEQALAINPEYALAKKNLEATRLRAGTSAPPPLPDEPPPAAEAPRPSPAVQAIRPVAEEIKGYAEWRAGDALIVDGQRVVSTATTRVTGSVRTFAAIPLGHEVKVKGVRQPGGSVAATEINAKVNGLGLFETELQQATTDIEREWLRAGAVTQDEDVEGKPIKKEIGKIVTTGPQVARVRGIVERVAPPYVDAGKVRVYVVTSKDWNAMAMANGAIWVFQGLLEDMNDDEVAFIVGHELAHVTHEHSRQANLKSLWATAVMLGGILAAEQIDNKAARVALEIAAVIAPLAWVNRYNRAQEDQADRVGLRYVYEGGFDPAPGANVWTRFQKKYGDTNRVLNFFVGDHSTARQRSERLRDQMALNYGPLAPPRQPSPPARASGAAGLTRGLVAPGGASVKPASTAILPGMPFESVRSALGAPVSETAAGGEARWVYDECTVVFTNGRVSTVVFDRKH